MRFLVRIMVERPDRMFNNEVADVFLILVRMRYRIKFGSIVPAGRTAHTSGITLIS